MQPTIPSFGCVPNGSPPTHSAIKRCLPLGARREERPPSVSPAFFGNAAKLKLCDGARNILAHMHSEGAVGRHPAPRRVRPKTGVSWRSHAGQSTLRWVRAYLPSMAANSAVGVPSLASNKGGEIRVKITAYRPRRFRIAAAMKRWTLVLDCALRHADISPPRRYGRCGNTIGELGRPIWDPPGMTAGTRRNGSRNDA
jgi:hypothetical protein